jgi:hypothetical protein
MNYQTFETHPDLRALIKCYWTLEVPASITPQRQRIVPDGCIEIVFILGDDIKRYTSKDKFILQPRAMVLGQTVKPFYVEPTGVVNSFAIRFYPYSFANFISAPIKNLVNKETPLHVLFGDDSALEFEQKIIQADDTDERIKIAEAFLFNTLSSKLTIDNIVKSTVDTLLSTKGNTSVTQILKGDITKRRQLERKFEKLIGISPKQLAKIIRLQASLKLMLNSQPESLTQIAYDSEYYDQAHFIRDFKEFTGTSPKDFLKDEELSLSAIFYEKD